MSKATAAITSKFKCSFIRVANVSESVAVQKMMHKLGFGVYPFRSRTVDNNDNIRFIYVNIHCDMFLYEKHCAGNTWRETNFEELSKAVQEVVTIKRREHKETKKRRALRKWDETATKRTTENCPVRRDVIIAAKLNSGEVITERADWFDWTTGTAYTGQDIASYKVLTPNKHKPKRVEGEWIEWKGGQCPIRPEDYVQIKFRFDNTNTPANQNANKCWWSHTGGAGDIVAYRIQPESERLPKIVTQEQMVDALADSIGKPLAIPVLGECQVLAPAGDPIPDTNPKKQYGVSSVPLNMWSPLASAYGSLALYNGSLKYGKANFANTKVEASIYIAAAMRHLLAWACGQEDDPADGVPNLGGVLANVAILLEARAAGMLIDDRLRMAGYLSELEMLKGKVKALNELHAGKNPKHYTLDQE